jgi:hypothetical protein
MPEMSVRPYRKIIFDKDGDIDSGQRDRLAESDICHQELARVVVATGRLGR